MPSKHANGTRSAVIRCPNCGEDYSITYKRCPFCDEKVSAPAERSDQYEKDLEEEHGDELGEEDRTSRRGCGKRVAGGPSRRGGGKSPLRIVLTAVSLVIIVAAIWIVATQIIPLVKRGDNLNKDPDSVTPSATQDVVTSPSPTDTATPGATDTPDVTPTPATPTIPADQTATGFTLSKSEFTMSDRYPNPIQLQVTFSPAGTTGAITWTSSNPDVAAVDETGTVTRGSKSGQTTITATMAGGFKQECTVRGDYAGGSSSSGSGTTGSLSLNRTDFTMYKAGETFSMKVTGTSSAPTWAIGNASVATISGDGTVTAVGKGQTTITCTVDGQKLECIVRVNPK